MLTNLIFFVLVSAGSVYAAARFGKRYEQTLPLCLMSMVLILFVFGLAGALEAGIVCLLVLALCFYILAGLRLVKKRDIRGVLTNLITPGSVFFVLAWVLLTLWNYGKVASSWDEFSHWMDIVKAVTYLGDFGTNPAAETTFQSYPPAMMLFQYTLQKVYMLVKPGAGFSEWRAYFAFQVFFLAVLLPFFQNITFRHPLKLALHGAIALLAPLLFYNNLYSAVYIDPILGILLGAGFAMTLLRPARDGLYTAYICLVCAMLTLSKDVGCACSLGRARAYAADVLMDRQTTLKKRLCFAPLALASAWLPKLLWSWELRTSGAKVSFGGKIDWSVLVNVLQGRDTSYRSGLIRTYRDALYSRSVSLGNVSLEINYVGAMLVFFCALYLLWRLFQAVRPQEGRKYAVILGLSAFWLAGYLISLPVIYMFKFSEYEAVRLASLERYLHIAYLGIWMLILLLAAHWVCQWSKRREWTAVLLVALLLAVPTRIFVEFTRGDYVSQSVAARGAYEPLRKAISQTCDGDDRIYFISQETSGFDYWVSRFNARPNSFNGNYTWSIGEAFYDGDVWTRKMTPEQWQGELLAQYDYVAVYKINDYFLEHFSGLFSDPDGIEMNTLYCVNRDTGLLDKCQ